MRCITIDSGTSELSGTRDQDTERQSVFAGLLRVASSLVSACRSGAALAMLSERDLDDLGLLTWEVDRQINPTTKRFENRETRRSGGLQACR